MAMAQLNLFGFLFSLAISHLFISGALATVFTLENKCEYTVWPGILSNPGVAPIPTTGFALQKGESQTINAPTSWAGRFWARTLCSQDSTGKFTCATGDCGSGKLECSGGAIPPATLAEFTLDGSGGMDFFDVSLVDGYNLPLMIIPQGGSGTNCSNTGCRVDLNGLCPSELKVMSEAGQDGVACKSACEAFQKPEYCCSGAFATPDTCQPSSYSQIFKQACPTAYSYAYDDKTSTFTCAHADYLITFCPSPTTSQKAIQEQAPPTTTPTSTTPASTSTGGTGMVYEGVSALDDSAASPFTWGHVLGSHAITGAVGMVIWQMLM